MERVVRAAGDLGIGTLTLYAFSSDNWRRPAGEVRSLMRLFRAYLRSQAEECAREGVRMRVIGRRDRIAPPLLREIERAEVTTGAGDGLDLRIALDYSARDSILAALGNEGDLDRTAFARRMGEVIHGGVPAEDVDLLIRTGGEQRLSDFLLWECAYAELYFTGRLWPDFGPEDLEKAISEFRSRERRFGSVPGGAGRTADFTDNGRDSRGPQNRGGPRESRGNRVPY